MSDYTHNHHLADLLEEWAAKIRKGSIYTNSLYSFMTGDEEYEVEYQVKIMWPEEYHKKLATLKDRSEPVKKSGES